MKSFILCVLTLCYSCTGIKINSHSAYEENVYNEELDIKTDLITSTVVNSATNTPAASLNLQKKFEKGKPLLWSVFGAHHKSGTALMNRLANYQARAMQANDRGTRGQCIHDGCGLFDGGKRCCHCSDWPRDGGDAFFKKGPHNDSAVWFACHFTVKQLESLRAAAKEQEAVQMRVVNVVRDPIALVVSGYLYHMHVNDHVPTLKMREMNIQEGIEIEARWALHNTVPEMVNTMKLGENDPFHSTVHLEDFMKSTESFDNMVSAIYDDRLTQYLKKDNIEGLKEKSKTQDLNRVGSTLEDHTASKDLKLIAKQAMEKIPSDILESLKNYGRQLGYVYK